MLGSEVIPNHFLGVVHVIVSVSVQTSGPWHEKKEGIGSVGCCCLRFSINVFINIVVNGNSCSLVP